ncbi:hypothetical protein OESDEN_10877 [Oesophagostomum dentatum]|uniref:Uncharacterized protein n=1 Tax=Oesophagostomum dentatum TaxID=61180 RepID=A0A0B1T0L2_OESDE|nr:hypothetical protein OESDEN_10877 [Oesophagostomum dentatum]
MRLCWSGYRLDSCTSSTSSESVRWRCLCGFSMRAVMNSRCRRIDSFPLCAS